MKDLIEYIGLILNIKIENKLVAVDITDELKDIADIADYKNFIRSNINHIDTQYMTGFQKFIKLTDIYKRAKLDDTLPHDTANTFSSELNNKVSQARAYIKNLIEQGEQRPFSRLQVDGHKFFTDKEIKALGELGSVSALIEMSEIGTLKDELIKLFMRKHLSVVSQNKLSAGNKRVTAMINKTTKGK